MPSSDVICPRCRLTNPPSAERCDCGYDFDSGVVAPSYLSPSQQAAQRPRPFDPRTTAIAFAAGSGFTALLLSVARLNGPKGTIGGATYLIATVATLLIAVGLVLLAATRTRGDAGMVMAAGVGSWIALYAGLRVLL